MSYAYASAPDPRRKAGLARQRQAARSPAGPPHAHEEDGNWLLTFSDLVLLLLCFVLLSQAINGAGAEAPASGATLATDGKRTPSGSAARLAGAQSVPLSVVHLEPARPAAATDERPSVGPDAAYQQGSGPEDSAADAWEALRAEMSGYLTETGLDEGVEITATDRDLLIRIRDTVPFDTGKADPPAAVLPLLERVVTLARARPDLKLEIAGHTDDVPIATSEFPSNWELSTARASRIARYLSERGVEPARISAQGHAYFHPLAPNTSAQNRAANRRVEVRLYGNIGDNGTAAAAP